MAVKKKGGYFKIHKTLFDNEIRMFYLNYSLQYVIRRWKNDGFNMIHETLKSEIKQLD